ncbi:hypothetical protein L227DRAFT_240573 [Lentinus tigrinus ALCF2SS1-6]|uniref:Uncharacterized protein n=1 Tax=Lentinus tigrinus ALCF2SS1-6 TaxID=1328759 RepID=A0A5C2S0N9_9APHY|nr:hypothetical protein L227DRAFT_240573 [Lentinus tigrinus ALCF2SS1-6]
MLALARTVCSSSSSGSRTSSYSVHPALISSRKHRGISCQVTSSPSPFSSVLFSFSPVPVRRYGTTALRHYGTAHAYVHRTRLTRREECVSVLHTPALPADDVIVRAYKYHAALHTRPMPAVPPSDTDPDLDLRLRGL